jgi:hypothetical protein
MTDRTRIIRLEGSSSLNKELFDQFMNQVSETVTAEAIREVTSYLSACLKVASKELGEGREALNSAVESTIMRVAFNTSASLAVCVAMCQAILRNKESLDALYKMIDAIPEEVKKRSATLTPESFDDFINKKYGKKDENDSG